MPNRIHNVQLVAHLIDDHFIAPGAEFSFNGTTGRAHRGQGIPRGAGDHQRRAPDRPRRRRLPGLDDGLQRRLRGRPLDHRAHEPRAVHQPLPARARRDGQLSRHRPQVRERHRSLALAAHLRRLVVADGRALRNPAAPPRRERGLAARRHRRPPPVKRVPDPNLVVGETSLEEYGSPSRSTSVRRRVYTSDGRSCSTTTRGTRRTVAEPRVVRVGTKPAPRPRSRRPKKKKKTPPPAASARGASSLTAEPLGLSLRDRFGQPGGHRAWAGGRRPRRTRGSSSPPRPSPRPARPRSRSGSERLARRYSEPGS